MNELRREYCGTREVRQPWAEEAGYHGLLWDTMARAEGTMDIVVGNSHCHRPLLHVEVWSTMGKGDRGTMGRRAGVTGRAIECGAVRCGRAGQQYTGSVPTHIKRITPVSGAAPWLARGGRRYSWRPRGGGASPAPQAAGRSTAGAACGAGGAGRGAPHYNL
ncbi:hypothetical protein Pmani_017561 [Petrolisthes manimaculis]|uniref:Uncharacterized protein n=1 Tax=Petrolisthes manimaculis TaxID=1843537 RepID=A0AAE1PM27_9EUCA|nr:hypothetical protein Pmani_017561 [Petrolisthes manimaculis]